MVKKAIKAQAPEETNPIITKSRPKQEQLELFPVESLPVKEVLEEKQFELSDREVEFLGASQYSDDAWLSIGRRHGVDTSTRQPIAKTNNRGFMAKIKKYAPLDPPQGQMVTTGSIDSEGVYHQKEAVPADSGAIRAEMSRRNLTKPTSPEIKQEVVSLDYRKGSLI